MFCIRKGQPVKHNFMAKPWQATTYDAKRTVLLYYIFKQFEVERH